MCFDKCLQSRGVLHIGDIKKAKEAGYHTCEALLMNTRKVCIQSSQFFHSTLEGAGASSEVCMTA